MLKMKMILNDKKTENKKNEKKNEKNEKKVKMIKKNENHIKTEKK